MGFLDFLKGAGEAVLEPFDIISRGVVEVLPSIQKQKQEERDRRIKMMDDNTKKIAEYGRYLKEGKDKNGESLDDAKRERYQNFIDMLGTQNDDLAKENYASVDETMKNTNRRKFLASVADVGLTIGTAGTYGAGAAGAKTGTKLATKEIAKNIAKQAGKEGIKKTAIKTVAPNVIEGIAGGTLSALQQDDPNAKSVATQAGIGGFIGGLIPGAQYAWGRRGSKYVDDAARKVVDDAVDMSGVDKSVDDFVAATRPQRALDVADNAATDATLKVTPTSQVDEFVDAVNPTKPATDVATKTIEAPEGSARKLLQSKIKTSADIKKATQKPLKDRFKENFFDKLSPINDLVKEVEQKTGRKLTTDENPYELGRLYAGMPAKVKQQINEYAKVVKDVPDLDAYRELGIARRVLGRPDIKSVISTDDAGRVIRELQQQFSPEDFAKLNAAVDGTVEYNKALFRSLGDAGIFEKGAIEDIIEKNPDYFTRFNVVSKLLKQAQTNVDQLKPGQTFNLSRQNVLKALKGMDAEEEILDPIESIVNSTDSIMRTIEKNNIFRSVQNLADDSDMVIKLRNADDVARRIDLSLDNKELRPIRNKIQKMVSTRSKRLGKLQTEINNLNKAGLAKSLKKGGKEALPEFNVEGLQDLGTRDTQRFIKSLIQQDDKTLKAIRKKIATRDPKVASLIDEISGLKSEYDDIANRIRNNIDEASELTDLNLPEGYEKISGWRDGIREDIAIPSEIAQAYKGLNSAQLDQATNFINKVNQVMKTSVTSLNVPFAIVRNPLRDFKTMAANSKNIDPKMRKIIKSWVKGAWEGYKGVTGRKGGSDLYDDWVASGGGGSGIYSRLDSGEKIAKNIANTVKGRSLKNPKDIPSILADIAKAPIDAVQNAGAILESAPRLAEFQAAIDNNKVLREAAFDSRNVTVDFNQSGKVGQVLNAWVPFLNARLQGNKKLLEAAGRDPKRFAKIYGMLTAAPIAATYALNSQYPEVMDQIPGYVKDGNFLMVFGDEQDENGNFTQVIKIPKSDIDKIFGNPLENFIDFARGKDAQSVDEVLLEFANSISPVDFVKDGGVNASRFLGGVTPVAFKAPLEFVTNKNLYFDSPTVSESMSRLPNEDQVKEDTSGVAQFLANLTGQSPIKTEQLLRSTTGSLTTGNPAQQLGSTVAGAPSSAVVSEFYGTLEQTQPLRAQASNRINEALSANDIQTAQQIADEYNQKLKEMFTPWAKQYGKYANADLQQAYNEQKINLSSRSIQQRYRNINQ